MSQLSDTLLTLLNEQYAHEKRNQLIYEEMASAMDFLGLSGAASFLKKQAAGEGDHAKIVYDYINQRNQLASIPGIEVPDVLGSFFGVFDAALAVENATTEKLTRLATQAMNEGDLMTFFWIKPLIDEQVEDEGIIQTILDRFATCGREQAQIQLYDTWIGSL